MDVAPRPDDFSRPGANVFQVPTAQMPTVVGNAKRARTILLVDDETDILESLAGVLHAQLADTKVLTASSGAAALVHIRSQPIGVILTDYRMPGMNGFELIDQARRIDPDVPVIM